MKLWVVLMLMPLLALSQEQVLMDFPGIELNIFLQWFSNFSGKKIIYSNEKGIMQKKIYMLSPKPVPLESVEKICMSILENNGLTLIESGTGNSKVYKLLEISRASNHPMKLGTLEELNQLETGDYYISQLVLLKHAKASYIIGSIKQANLLESNCGNIVEITGANALIIYDFIPNVKKIVKIIDMLDKKPREVKIEWVELQYAKASEVSQKLQQLFQHKLKELSQHHFESHLAILPDIATNSITIRGTLDEILEVKNWIQQYDRKLQET